MTKISFKSPYDVLIHPFVTEKTMVQMERENKLEFVVNRKANKPQIKEAFETMFEVKVTDVNVKIKKDGKHAIIKLDPEVSAEEIGMRVGCSDMGKPLRVQRRGKGGSAYTSPSHRHRGGVKNPKVQEAKAVVKYLDDDPGRTAPIAVITYEDGHNENMLAAEGMSEGQEISVGPESPIISGNVLPLGKIPEGTPVYNIESKPGDGGKFARAAGTNATVVSQGDKVTVKLPSERFIHLPPTCKAVVGVVAGTGRGEKPFAKAGKVFHARRSRAREHFRVSGIAMNPVNHPHGGGGHPHVGVPSTVSVHAPPGRKVGRLSPQPKKKKGRK